MKIVYDHAGYRADLAYVGIHFDTVIFSVYFIFMMLIINIIRLEKKSRMLDIYLINQNY